MMSTPAALHVRPARIADARMWVALAMVALQIVLLPPPGVSIGTTPVAARPSMIATGF